MGVKIQNYSFLLLRHAGELSYCIISDVTILQAGCRSIGRYLACDAKSYMAS
jgi:hypothetical protein